jgi:hypothetical protein
VGDEVKAIFVLEVLLKHPDFDAQNIAMLAKLIPQKMLFVLRYEDKAKLAIYHTKLFQTEWRQENEMDYDLLSNSYSLDALWNGIVSIVGEVRIESGKTLTEQIVADETRQKLLRQITQLEKQLTSTKQPHRKRELFEEIKKLKGEL